MPAIRKIVGPRGSGFWSSFDPNDNKLVAEALKKEFQRSEPAHDIHYAHSRPDHLPPNALNLKIGRRDEGNLCQLKEEQEKYWTEKEAAKRKQYRPWNRVLTKFRRGEPEVQQVQCATQ